MQSIIISKEDFDREFDITLDKLLLAKLEKTYNDENPNSSMHRKFHYEVCMLKARLEKG